MRLSIAQQVLMSLLVVTCGLILHSVKISLLLLEQQHEGDEHLLQKQAWKSTNDNNPQKLSFQPRALFQDWWDAMTLQGGTSCDTVLQNVRQGIWMDPNHQQGQHFVRRISTAPHHYVSLHHPDYDRVRYKSIFEKGEYYERKVHARFESILQENNVAKNATALPIVVDVGANIGYYSLLSAAYHHAVISFEINPSNLIRICESIHWNQQYYKDFGPIRLFRHGVSSKHHLPVQVLVPKRNPGEAKVLPMTTDKQQQQQQQQQQQAQTNLTSTATTSSQQQPLHATQYHSFATTVTLDALAQEHGWLPDSDNDGDNNNNNRPNIAILKIDTEGHEPHIVQGAIQLLQSNIVQNVLMEYRTTCRDSVVANLLEVGYVLVYDEPSTNRPRTMLSKEQSKTVLDKLHQTWAKDGESEEKYNDLWFRLASHKLPSPSTSMANKRRS